MLPENPAAFTEQHCAPTKSPPVPMPRSCPKPLSCQSPPGHSDPVVAAACLPSLRPLVIWPSRLLGVGWASLLARPCAGVLRPLLDELEVSGPCAFDIPSPRLMGDDGKQAGKARVGAVSQELFLSHDCLGRCLCAVPPAGRALRHSGKMIR